MKFLNNLDLQSNELQNAVIHNYAGNPDGNLSGTEGQIVYSTTLDALFYNDGAAATSWEQLATGTSAVASVTAGDTSIVVGGTATNPTIAHADTSTVSDLTAASRTYVDSLTFDTYGHVTGYTTSSESVVNSNTTYDLSLEAGGVIRLTGSDTTTDDVTIAGAGGATISQAGSTLTITTANDNDIDYVNGSSFTNGTLALTGVGNAGTSISLDGRYLLIDDEDFGFKTIAVSGQSDVVADATDDTLTLAAAGGMTITTNATTDTITFSSANDNDIDYINSASFNSTTGDLTLSGVGNAGASVSLEGRYLTEETDTLDTVTGRGATTTNAVTVGDLTVNGDLTVSGSHVVTLAEEVRVEDSLFVLNHGFTGTPAEDAGLLVERGTATNVAMIWDESADEFVFGTTAEAGADNELTLAGTADVRLGALEVDGVLKLDSVANGSTDPDKFLTINASGQVEYRTGAEVLSDIGAGTGNGSMDDFTITDGTTATTVADADTVTLQGTGLISVANVGGTFTVSTTANNYAHPTQTAINASGTGATVVDGVTVNTLGHTTAVSTRTVTLADLGYTGATDANNYVLPSATASVVGGVELATPTEASAGTDTTRAVTPEGLDRYNTDREAVYTISGDATNTAFTLNHGFGTRMVMVEVVDYGDAGTGATYETVYPDIDRPNDDDVTITFGSAPSADQDYKVMLRRIA
jgi:hypothetical protein